MMGLGLQSLAQIFATRLLNTTVEGMAIAALVWILLRLTGKQNSGTRFAVWFSALLMVAALPFVAADGSHAQLQMTGRPAFTLSAAWAIWIFAAWMAVSLLSLLRLGFGFWHLRILRRDSLPVDLTALDPSLADLLRAASARRVRVCVSDRVTTPAALGFFRPFIILPAWALCELSVEELKVILLHELAHLHRWDDWTNFAQKAVKAMFFFHPAVWWIETRLVLEREMACDDLVLAHTANPKAYAASLISFAEKVQHGRSLTLAQAVVSRMRQTSLRITQILAADRPRATRIWKPVMGIIAMMSLVALLAAPHVPRLFAFQDPAASNAPTRASNSVGAPPIAISPVRRAAAALRPTTVMKPKAIATRYQPPIAGARLQTPAHNPQVTLAKGDVVEPRDVVFVLETTQRDAFGSRVMTICVWRFTTGNGSSQRQLETAIVVKI